MNSELTALEIEIQIMEFFGVRQNIIVPNISWGIANLHECDLLILSKHNYATEVEIKISKSDIVADKKKRHNHYHNHIARLFFAVPDLLSDFAIENIPARAGLITVTKEHWPKVIKRNKRNMYAHQWTDKERLKLLHLGTMRILGLKKRIKLARCGKCGEVRE